MMFLVILLLGTLGSIDAGTGTETDVRQVLPSVYEYFQTVNESPLVGLVADADGFKLNGKLIRIVSGAIHYFRTHPNQWRDRLQKLRAMGANTVETYVPWNLHEPNQDYFDFGNGNEDMSAFLDVRRFVQMAQEEDLLVIFRPGPFICAEWEFGGLPSWLQRDPNMNVRTSYQPYLDRVKIYLDNLLAQIVDLQFSRGGSIIAVQLENEYAVFWPIDLPYMVYLKEVVESNDIDSLIFTSDNSWNGFRGTPPGVFLTVNFQTEPEQNLETLREIQPDKPLMVMEFWTGWYDYWFGEHNLIPAEQFEIWYETILRYNASVNLYMFHGGTNFGFMAGVTPNWDAPYDSKVVTTSYDYDSPLTESGGYTEKYYKARDLIETYQIPPLHRPALIAESPTTAYPRVELRTYLNFNEIINQIPSDAKFIFNDVVSMENLPMNNKGGTFSGQSYGYIIYRIKASFSVPTSYWAGPVQNFAVLIVDGVIKDTQDTQAVRPDYWIDSQRGTVLEPKNGVEQTIDLLIENSGRHNVGGENEFKQQKGLPADYGGYISLNGVDQTRIETFALEFKSDWVKSLSNWKTIDSSLQAPCLMQATFEISGQPTDTYLDVSSWHKGIVFVNGFNIGRYFKVGPYRNLYIPAPLLKTGSNTITIFEQLNPGSSVAFRESPYDVEDAPGAVSSLHRHSLIYVFFVVFCILFTRSVK
ncbi:beta-galactosidase-1-like protein 2 [Bradysia coprophila]|uniref:beta-galactosidase-1-like protein 2 n=1 Tax=Bradysia coprophila TaxID=38358 RepID=UPI00187D823D|nr:beta-galactosidase-1-like protein 2 [Bradysia coprophila]